jgi:aminopeptidase
MDARIDKVADILVNYSTAVRRGDLVLIRVSDPLAESMAVAVQKYVLKAGGIPSFLMVPSGAVDTFFQYADNKQLQTAYPIVNEPLYVYALEKFDVMITLRAESNTKSLNRVDPARATLAEKGRAAVSKTFMKRQGSGALRWTLTQVPTQASAQDAGMSLSEYEDFVYGAGRIDLKDPVAWWKKFSKEQARLTRYLKGKDKVEVKGEHIDLTLSIKGRTFINADGKKNFPDGEIFTGPVEHSVNGWVRFTYPAIYRSHEVEDVKIEFENGRAVSAKAAKGQDYLNATLNTDKGSRFLGEFAIGNNDAVKQFTRNILFDEKMGGTVHMAFGAGYPDTGSHNESSVHWDMICDMRSGGEIYVDGKLFYKNGKFKV